jgi:glycosyltransferase involved in cell wall biosynthesis
MPLPTISVITPSYNQGQFIGQTVESVLGQQYPGLDYIVIDGASTDNTLAVLQPYTDQLRLISEPDRGQTDALNKGLRMATGEVVCWLNSDDYFLPNTLQIVGEFFAKNPQKRWLTADCVIVDEIGHPIQKPIRQYKRLLRQLNPAAYLGVTNAVCQPATFWRRSVHTELGYLNETLRYTMDYDWWLRLNGLQSPAVLPDTLTAFRIHGASKGGSQFEKQFAEDYQTLCSHESNSLIRGMHKAHNSLITGVYRLIK